jgi:molybdopterin/thiamine biosynthesis adenylyltransferase
MSEEGERFSRQTRLSEVSESGQERLGRSIVEVRGRDGADVERTYLERAGVGLVTTDPDSEPLPFPHAQAFRFVESRRVGAGAYRALVGIRTVLGLVNR